MVGQQCAPAERKFELISSSVPTLRLHFSIAFRELKLNQSCGSLMNMKSVPSPSLSPFAPSCQGRFSIQKSAKPLKLSMPLQKVQFHTPVSWKLCIFLALPGMTLYIAVTEPVNDQSLLWKL